MRVGTTDLEGDVRRDVLVFGLLEDGLNNFYDGVGAFFLVLLLHSKILFCSRLMSYLNSQNLTNIFVPYIITSSLNK
jgi:hypothetical protein